MKEVKYSSVGSSSSSSVESVAGSVVTSIWNPKLPSHFNAGLASVAVVSLMMVMQIRDSDGGFFDDMKRLIHPVDLPELVDMPQRWNESFHQFLPIISDWDDQRVRWMEGDPNFKALSGARPRVLMVTGSSQDEGELYILSHLLLRAGKNKQDYTQMHDMDLFYNMVNPDPEFSGWWVKLPVIRMLMLRHPEVEWIWWLDADAVITDMTYEPPFAKLDRYNLVLYGEEATAISTGVFMIRNCQWSLDLLTLWAYTGTESKRKEARDFNFEGEMEVNQTMDIVPGDDRSSLVVLLAQDRGNPSGHQKWVPKVKLVEESEHVMSRNWTVVGPQLEELSRDKDQHVVPFVTHFEGCLPHPSEVPRFAKQNSANFNACVEQLDRAFDFAENQVYRELGLERNTLGNSSEPFTWKNTPSEESTETAFSILPSVTGWDEKRTAYMESNPWIRKDSAVLVSGSSPKPCKNETGSHLLVRGLKNKIDYSRLHGIKMFYNMAIIHTTLTGWWSKLPVLKLMMINSPDVEWIWWTDSDAVFTSMDFKMPFERYNANGYNLILWGAENEVFDLKKYNGVNTGDVLIRNCQWSLDLFDKWAPLANLTEEIVGTFLDRPRMGPADDQSALVYLLVTEREKWASKIYFENEITLSGDWTYWSNLFLDEYKMRADRRPLMTHFTGCHPCWEDFYNYDLCLERLDRAYNFADNQVLENYGLRHERLNSSHIVEDFQRDAEVWSDYEINRMITKSDEELPASNKEVDPTKEQEVEPETKDPEEQKVEPAREHEEVTETKEEGKVDPTKEQDEVTTTTVDEEATLTKEEDQVTTIREDEQQGVLPNKEDEQTPTIKEDEQQGVTANKEDEQKVPSEEQGVDHTKEDSRDEKVDRPQESDSGNETKEEVERQEKVDRPEEESELGKVPKEVLKDEKVEPTETHEMDRNQGGAP